MRCPHRNCRCRRRACCRHCACRCCCHHCRCCHRHCGIIPVPPLPPTMTAVSVAPHPNCRCHRCCRQRGGGGARALWPTVFAPFSPLPLHPQGGSGSSWRWRRRQSSPPILVSPFPPQQRAVWWLTYIGTTDSTTHTVLQRGHWRRCSCRARDEREEEENNDDDGGAVG
jgi:hypothetical protein